MMNNRAQTMVLEAVTFAVVILIALIFALSFTPKPMVKNLSYTNKIKILANDALRSIDTLGVEGYFGSMLVKCIATNDKDELTYLLNLSLPSYVSYNIYVGNGERYVKWYDGEKGFGKIGNVARAHRIIVIPPSMFSPGYRPIPGYGYNDTECVYDVVLEVWTW